jgi:hypothetical protein
MWLFNNVKLGGNFSDCQDVIAATYDLPSFAKYKTNKKTGKKIKPS